MDNKLVSQNDLKKIESKQILIGKALNCPSLKLYRLQKYQNCLFGIL